MLFGESLIGALHLDASSPGDIGESQIQIANEIAARLAIGIQQAQLTTQIEQHAQILEKKVAERTADLEAANNRLQTVNQLREEFVANMSHELRTPVTNLKLYLNSLEKRPENHAH